MIAALEAWESRETKERAQERALAPEFARCRPTGITSLDGSLPGYGFPIDGMTDLRGESWGDKVALAMGVLSCATVRGQRTAYVDGRRAIQPAVAEAFGVNRTRLLLATPRDCLQGLKAAEVALGSGRFGVVALDLKIPMVNTRGGRLEGLLRRLMFAAQRGRSMAIWLSEKPWPLPTSLRLEISAARRGVRVRRLSGTGARSPAWKVTLPMTATSCAPSGD